MGAQSRWPDTRPSIMVRIGNGDQNAWSEFVEIYRPLIYAFAHSRGLQDADADDVTQRVSAKVNGFEYDQGKGHFRGWLGRVTAREIMRRIRCLNVQAGAKAKMIRRQPWKAFHRLKTKSTGIGFRSALADRALARIRSEFSVGEWEVFEAVAFRRIATSEGLQYEQIQPPPYKLEAEKRGKEVSWVYQVKYQITKCLKQEIVYLAESLEILT